MPTRRRDGRALSLALDDLGPFLNKRNFNDIGVRSFILYGAPIANVTANTLLKFQLSPHAAPRTSGATVATVHKSPTELVRS
jgi:hypothetical protein